LEAVERLIEYREQAGVAHIRINRAEKRNALNHAMWSEIRTLADGLQHREDLRLLVIEGAGEHFSAGGDLEEMKSLVDDVHTAVERLDAPLMAAAAVADIPFPTLAVLRGSVFGGGCELALACDLRVADSTTTVGIPPAKIGLVYGARSTARLVATVGLPVARRMLFTGEPLRAEEVHAVGLVDHLVAPEELDAFVDALKQTLLQRSRTSLQGMKRILGRIEGGLADDDAESTALRHASYLGADFREGVRAFVERRPPEFH